MNMAAKNVRILKMVPFNLYFNFSDIGLEAAAHDRTYM